MANLKEVKSRITSVMSTQQITKAMKMVSAAKLRRAQDRIIQMRPYAEKLNGILQNVSSSVDESEVDNPYGVKRSPEKILLVPISSDKGLCGAFNTNINRKINLLLKGDYARQHEAGQVTLLPVGKKSMDYFKKRSVSMNKEYSDIFSDVSFENVSRAAEFIMKQFEAGVYDKVILVYNEFKNAATQYVQAERFLPVETEAITEVAEGPVKGASKDYIFEPDQAFIIQELIPTSLKIQFYKAVLESNASEHGARMTAMDKATDNAGELLKELRLTYNRTRQAAITTEILEIVAGAEALDS